MPIIKNVKTVVSDDNPWSSPDGKVKIWNIKLETSEGDRLLYPTMSKAIAEYGWTGDIEVYTNAKGKDYVRQAPKEDAPKSFSKSEQKFEKDLSDTPLRVFNAGLPYVDSVGLMNDPKYLGKYLDYVQTVSDHLVSMMNNIRSGGEKPTKELENELEDVTDESRDVLNKIWNE